MDIIVALDEIYVNMFLAYDSCHNFSSINWSLNLFLSMSNIMIFYKFFVSQLLNQYLLFILANECNLACNNCCRGYVGNSCCTISKLVMLKTKHHFC